MWPGMQVHAMTSNIKEIRGTIVNLKSNNYMYINKSESKNMHRKQYRKLKYNKHVINIFNMR